MAWLWPWVLALAGLAALGCVFVAIALRLLRFRYAFRLAFPGACAVQASVRAPYFKRNFHASGEPSEWLERLWVAVRGEDESQPSGRHAARPPAPPPSQAGFVRLPRLRWDANRAKRAGFLFATHSRFWVPLFRYVRKETGSFFWLLNPKITASLGHPDSIWLAKIGSAHAAWSGGLPQWTFPLELRFQDRRPTGRMEIEGGASGLRLAVFLLLALLRLPLLRWGFFALRCWRRPRLAGWRGWLYAKIQTT